MIKYLKMLGAAVIAVMLTVFGLTKAAISLIGASTTPDDFALLEQRAPRILAWLFTTPWWVPSIILLVLLGAAVWLFISATQQTIADEMEDQQGLSRSDVATIASEEAARLLAEYKETAPAPVQNVIHQVPPAPANENLNRVEKFVVDSVRADLAQTYIGYVDHLLGELERYPNKHFELDLSNGGLGWSRRGLPALGVARRVGRRVSQIQEEISK